jgi:hypothetical protein
VARGIGLYDNEHALQTSERKRERSRERERNRERKREREREREKEGERERERKREREKRERERERERARKEITKLLRDGSYCGWKWWQRPNGQKGKRHNFRREMCFLFSVWMDGWQAKHWAR